MRRAASLLACSVLWVSSSCGDEGPPPDDAGCGCDPGFVCEAGECRWPCTGDDGCAGVGAGRCGEDGYCLARCLAEEGYCHIGGACYAAGEARPDNPCEVCDPVGATEAWTADDAASCDDGLFCTVGDHCAGGRCVVEGSRDCADGLYCTDDLCNESSDACENPVAPGTCLIDSLCHPDGQADSGNPCLVCDAAAEPLAWTSADGAPCDDGEFCSATSRCDAGECVVATARDCSDGLDCTTDGCDEEGDGCTHALAADACLVGGRCFAAGAPDPQNPCVECDPGVSQEAFTADDTNTCEDDLFCTRSNTCVAGACVFASMCDDGVPCTADLCDEAARGCSHTVEAGSCLVDGVCYQAGEASAASICEACVPDVDQAAFTSLTPVFTVAAGDTAQCQDTTLTAGCMLVEGTLRVTGTCRLEATAIAITGLVDADQTGFGAGSGPGSPGPGGDGAAHGGDDGRGGSASSFPGAVYGDVDDARAEPGSGGGEIFESGGAGGGAVEIAASEVRLSGTLRANGGAGQGDGFGSGGGSGGGVAVEADLLTVASGATITANGGRGGNATGFGGGGGGGGRIELRYADGSVAPGAVVTVNGGAGGTAAYPGAAGGRGTIYDAGRSPVLFAIDPAAAYYGDEVRFLGFGFGAAPGVVRFYDRPGSIVSWTDTEVVTVVPAGIVEREAFIVAGGLASNGVVLGVENPIVTSARRVSPAPPGYYCQGSLCIGELVEVRGNGFGATRGTSEVLFGDGSLSATPPADGYQAWSDTSVTTEVACPGAAGSFDSLWLEVDARAGNTARVVVTSPRVSAVGPSSATAGATVRINIDEWTINPEAVTDVQVRFGSAAQVPATFDVGLSAVTVTVPADAPSGQQEVEITFDGCAARCPDAWTCAFTRT